MKSRFLAHMTIEEFKILLREILKEVLDEEKRTGLDTDCLLSTREAALLLNLEVTTLYDKTSQRLIPHYKRGKKVLFKKSELLAWIEAGKVATTQEIQKDASQHIWKRMP
ncbi:helix-turn-helix domain-containing protein [Chryseolinea soli]|uniref:DNA-binding protein n=1 Tax=Chryseolinea soli TaxID=2321403 RepID=A0A385SXQ4_9BACT|nr:helix-turn-helix domain-containing protein [Chryseolinea soli]AYB34825.1 DNA-binding protein [Chryseolinea soli]